MTFQDEAKYLRNTYILVGGKRLNLEILTKLQSYAFYNEYTTVSLSDTLPIGRPISIDCSSLHATRTQIEKTLTEVLNDLKYNDFSVAEERPFNETHKLVITIK